MYLMIKNLSKAGLSVMRTSHVKNIALLMLVLVGGLGGCAMVKPQANQAQRGVAQYLQDQSNSKKILDALYSTDARFKYARIQPHVFMGVLLLNGQVPDAYLGELAIEAIQQKANVSGISLIHNYLTTEEKPTYQQIAQDAYITATVKKGVYALSDVSDKTVYITTEKAVLTVMGRVSETNANAIVSVAQQTPGVAKVVMLVDIVKQQEMPAPAAKAVIPVVNNSLYVVPVVSPTAAPVATPTAVPAATPTAAPSASQSFIKAPNAAMSNNTYAAPTITTQSSILQANQPSIVARTASAVTMPASTSVGQPPAQAPAVLVERPPVVDNAAGYAGEYIPDRERAVSSDNQLRLDQSP